MAHEQDEHVLGQLRDVCRSRGLDQHDRVDALRAVKREIVGHLQQKEWFARRGVLGPIVDLLERNRPSPRLNGHGSLPHAADPRSLSDQESVRLHALQLLASFADGGPPFLAPLHTANAIPAILDNLSPANNPSRVVTAALHALINIADTSAVTLPAEPLQATRLADAVLSPNHAQSIKDILLAGATPPCLPTEQAQANLAASLISRLCLQERHQIAMVDSEVLDGLAALLASFAVARGEAVPSFESDNADEGLGAGMLGPRPSRLKLAYILEAISSIVSDSKYRVGRLLWSPWLAEVFPSGSMPSRRGADFNRYTELMDALLPSLPVGHSKSPAFPASSFSPLGYAGSRGHVNAFSGSHLPRLARNASPWDEMHTEPHDARGDISDDDPETPLIPWLIHLTRSKDGIERLLAASLVTSFYKAGYVSKFRESAIGLLIVPLLMQLLKDAETDVSGTDTRVMDSETALRWAVQERTPAVVARIISDNDFLQRTAYDCNGVKVFSKLLKTAYEPLSKSPSFHQWSPNDESKTQGDDRSVSSPLGRAGHHPLYIHRMRMRENALKAIGALAAGQDEYRKAFVEQDIITFIVESLHKSPSRPQKSKDEAAFSRNQSDSDAVSAGYDSNPANVVIAACHAIRVFGRSVSILRTALGDHEIAKPMLKLLNDPDIEVRIAATSASCNLVTEVSPMSKTLKEGGIMDVLCSHAHSSNASLKLEAMWALKHFVLGVSTDVKKRCLEQLHSGRLIKLIRDEEEDKSRPEGQVDQMMDEDVEMDQSEDRIRATWNVPASSSTGAWSSGLAQQRAERKRRQLADLRDAESNITRKARNDDLAIQEQGLGFIRNLVMPAPGAGSDMRSINDTAEMIDHLLNVLSQDQFFDILASKLRIRVSQPFNRRESRVLYPQARIVDAVVLLLVHIAASVPRHRQLVIAQTDLLKLLVTHFNSRVGEVRSNLCQLIANLTCQEDGNDSHTCAQRAIELKKLGFVKKLEALEGDEELDVRERAKRALGQIKEGGRGEGY